MNNTFLIFASFLIALLCHVLIFNYCTVVFPIDPVPFKPKFFFLGPILKQIDVSQTLSDKANTSQIKINQNFINHTESKLRNIHYKQINTKRNPFAIGSIQKPSLPQTDVSSEKIVIKSLFIALPEIDPLREIETGVSNLKLNIKPYQPLRSHSR